MTKAEAGKLGGVITAGRYGRDYMCAIGRNGGLLGGRPTWQESILRHTTRVQAKTCKNEKGGLRVLGSTSSPFPRCTKPEAGQ